MVWNYWFSVLLVGREWFKRSFPPGFVETLPYHIIPHTAISIPITTWTLRPSLPKKKNPITKTSMVFMCPRTWKETAVNLPMQINWLRFVPTAIVHDINMNICKSQPQNFRNLVGKGWYQPTYDNQKQQKINL